MLIVLIEPHEVTMPSADGEISLELMFYRFTMIYIIGLAVLSPLLFDETPRLVLRG